MTQMGYGVRGTGYSVGIVCALACALLTATTALPASAQGDGGAVVERLKAYHYGGDASAADAVEQWVASVRGDAAGRREAARLLAGVLSSGAAFEAKELACRQLAVIGGEEQVPALTALLGDEQLGHYALYALAQIPGRATDEALRKAAKVAPARAQLAILDTLGERRDVQAVPLLSGLLAAPDAAVASAAAEALAKIGAGPAAAALRRAYGNAREDRRSAFAKALVDCAARMRPTDAAGARAIYAQLDAKPASPEIAAAALRGIVLADGEKALPRVIAAYGIGDTPRQRTAFALSRELPGKTVTARLTSELPRLPAPEQVLLVEALADRGDPLAARPIAKLAASADPNVRLTAIRALGALSDASTVGTLLEMASAPAGAPQVAARASLADLRDPTVDQQLVQAARSTRPAVRAAAIRALGDRRAAGDGPLLLESARDEDATVRAVALQVLKENGLPGDLPGLVKLLLMPGNTDPDAVLDAAVEVARRGETEEERIGPILSATMLLSDTPRIVRLLTLAGQVGGPRALATLRAAAGSTEAEMQLAAVRQLAEWPTAEPMPDLLNAVRSGKTEKVQAVALHGYIRLIGLDETRTPDQAVALYRDAAGAGSTPQTKRLVLAGLAKLSCLQALDYAASLAADPAVKDEADLALVEIGRATVGAYPDQTAAALKPIAEGAASEELRGRAREVLALPAKVGDFDPAWEVSPAYQREGANWQQLFDLPFAPEEPDGDRKTPWRAMPIATSAEQPWLLDLLALWGGEQKVAYLRTAVWSDSDRDLVMKLGSDDGVKAWWNGQVALADNTQRAVSPDQESVAVKAKAGWNSLLLKVTQNNQGWGACARFRNPDGSPATGLRYAARAER